MFKIGYWYKWNEVKYNFWKDDFYKLVCKWHKCTKINNNNNNIHFKTIGNGFFGKESYNSFKESKFNPSIKRKLRMILK